MNKNSDRSSPDPAGRSWSFFLITFATTAASIAAISYGVIAYTQNIAREQLVASLKVAERQAVTAMRREAETTLLEVTSDLLAFRKLVERKLSVEYDELGLARVMQDFMHSHRTYDQLGLLDRDGFERIRIDNEVGGAVLITGAQLQDRSQSRYFRAAQQLGDNELLISQLGANDAAGALEKPVKPVIRMLARVPGDGYIVLNYLARNLMEGMQSVGSAALGEPRVVSRLGLEALSAMSAGTSEALASAPSATGFTDRYPAAWRAMNTSTGDAVDDGAGGLMVYTQFIPGELSPPSSFIEDVSWTLPMNTASDAEGGWFIVSHIDRARLQAMTRLGLLNSPTIMVLYAALVVALASLIASWLSRQRGRTARLKVLASRDSLTDLLTRSEFDQRLTATVAHVERFGRTAALVSVDVNNFKQINESLGHSAGDQLLLHVANVLRSTVRTADVVGRVGGDEFAVVLTEVRGPQDTERVVEKIRRGLDRTVILAGSGVRVSASVGGATFPNDATSVPELYRQADRAMSRDKDEPPLGEHVAA